MSGFVAEDGSLAVSTEDFRAALMGGAESDAEPTAATPEPAQTEDPAETPATATTEAQTETPEGATPPAQTPDELATLRAEMVALRQEQERQRGTYDNNTRQQREALEAAKREADTLRQQHAALTKSQAEATEAQFKAYVADWEARIKAAPDGAEKTAARTWLDAEVKGHAADQKAAEAQRLTETFAPVMQQLEGLRVQNEIASTVQRNLDLIQTQGAEQLAREVGAPVDEIRAFLKRPDVAQQYAPIFALMRQEELAGRPVPVGLLNVIGTNHRTYWAEKVADRKAAEDRLIESNQRQLVASGATRADGGGGAGAPPKSIDTFADVTSDMYARAAGIRRR